MKWWNRVGVALAGACAGFSAVQVVVNHGQRSFFVALALYSIVAMLHDLRELRKPSEDVQLTGAEYRLLMIKLHELHDAGHLVRPEYLAVVLGWPLPKVRAALRLLQRCGVVEMQ